MRIYPLGDAAITIECSDSISLESHFIVSECAAIINAAIANNLLVGATECVAAFTSVSVLYNPLRVSFVELSAALRVLCGDVLTQRTALVTTTRQMELPICFDNGFALDIEPIASYCDLDVENVIALLLAPEYRVAMIGFTPGFPYMLGLPHELHTPRKATPRLRVPAGSVAIGGGQLGVYPFESPGGWNIVGRTPLTLFEPDADPPSFFHAGDSVRLRMISREEFESWRPSKE